MKKKNPIIQLRESDIKRIKRETSDQAVKSSFTIFFTVMRDKKGWGIKRLQGLYDDIQDLADSISKGYVSLFDLEKVLREEANINIFMKEGD